MIHLVWLSILAFVAFLAVYVAATWRLRSKARWFGLAAILSAIPFAYLVGQVTAEFDTDACYSTALDLLATAVETTSDGATAAARIRSLPLSGFETNCTDVLSAVERLSSPASGASDHR